MQDTSECGLTINHSSPGQQTLSLVCVGLALSAEHGSILYGCQSCSWSVEQGEVFLCPSLQLRILPCATSSAILSCASPLILQAQVESCSETRIFYRFPRPQPHIPSNAIESVPSLSGHATTLRWCSLPRIHRHRASSSQCSSSNGSCLFEGHHGSTFVCLSLPTPTIGTVDTVYVFVYSHHMYR